MGMLWNLADIQVTDLLVDECWFERLMSDTYDDTFSASINNLVFTGTEFGRDTSGGNRSGRVQSNFLVGHDDES
jgi:hypothetical protein